MPFVIRITNDEALDPMVMTICRYNRVRNKTSSCRSTLSNSITLQYSKCLNDIIHFCFEIWRYFLMALHSWNRNRNGKIFSDLLYCSLSLLAWKPACLVGLLLTWSTFSIPWTNLGVHSTILADLWRLCTSGDIRTRFLCVNAATLLLARNVYQFIDLFVSILLWISRWFLNSILQHFALIWTLLEVTSRHVELRSLIFVRHAVLFIRES